MIHLQEDALPEINRCGGTAPIDDAISECMGQVDAAEHAVSEVWEAFMEAPLLGKEIARSVYLHAETRHESAQRQLNSLLAREGMPVNLELPRS